MYRDADFDIETDRTSVASLFVGLKEDYGNAEFIKIPIRKVNSSDDVSRFHRYFTLVQRNQGKVFKWRHYLKILHDGFRNFKAPVFPKKVQATRVASAMSEVSSYATARESATSLRTPSFRNRCGLFKCGTRSSPAIVANRNPLSLNVGSHVLKICHETKNLARDMYSKVGKSLYPPTSVYVTPKSLTKEKRHRVRTVERTGDTHGTPSSFFRRGKSYDIEYDCVSSSPVSTPIRGAGDRKRRSGAKRNRHH